MISAKCDRNILSDRQVYDPRKATTRRLPWPLLRLKEPKRKPSQTVTMPTAIKISPIYRDGDWNFVRQSEREFAARRKPHNGRVLQLNNYLKKLLSAGDIVKEVANRAQRSWQHLSTSFNGKLAVPDVAPGPNGELLFVWDKGDHHMELEIFPGGSSELFYRNRESGELWEGNYSGTRVLSDNVKRKLRLFTHAKGETGLP